MTPERYTVQYSHAHKLWLVFDRVTGNFCDHSETEASARAMAARRSYAN